MGKNTLAWPAPRPRRLVSGRKEDGWKDSNLRGEAALLLFNEAIFETQLRELRWFTCWTVECNLAANLQLSVGNQSVGKFDVGQPARGITLHVGADCGGIEFIVAIGDRHRIVCPERGPCACLAGRQHRADYCKAGGTKWISMRYHTASATYSNSYPSIKRSRPCSLARVKPAAPPTITCRPLLNSVFRLSSAYC